MSHKHYFIIGAQRSGTTYLSKILDQHPEIIMAKPIIPEPKYFLDINRKSYSYQEYLDLLFPKRKKSNILIEKTTAYFEKLKTFRRIKKIIKNFKVIVILRNPVDRAISHYNFSKSSGLEKLNFKDAINFEKKRSLNWENLIKKKVYSNPYAYIERGKYYKYIYRWEKLVGRKNLIIIISENLFGNLRYIQNVYEKLHVNKNFIPKKFKFKINNENYKKNDFLALSSDLKKLFRKSNKYLTERYKLNLSKWDI